MARKWLGYASCCAAFGLACGGNTGESRGTAPTEAGSGGGSPTPSGGSDAAVGGSGGQPSLVGGNGDAGAASMPADNVPRPYRAVQLATGRYHSCALLENHQIKCWGSNSYGQLGLGLPSNRGLDPAQMGDALPFVDLGMGRSAKAVAAGRYSTCALLDDDSVKCWGMNLFRPSNEAVGSIGDEVGEMGDELEPLPLGGGRTGKAVGVGYDEACIARDDASYYCSGASGSPVSLAAIQGTALVGLTGAQSVLGLYEDGAARALGGGMLASGVLAMAGSRFAECFLLQGEQLQCSGDFAPFDGMPAALPGATALGVSERGILCAIHQGGLVRCWGGTWNQPWVTTPRAESVVVPLSGPAVAISSGALEHQCALLQGGAVECWGWLDVPTDALGWDATGSSELEPVDLGTHHP